MVHWFTQRRRIAGTERVRPSHDHDAAQPQEE